VYSATKHAVRVISEGLCQEVKPYNIRSTIISPGAQSRPNCQIASPSPISARAFANSTNVWRYLPTLSRKW
jgi:NADP-dependent 3-hydroxy acid dehydrogenase YdfG